MLPDIVKEIDLIALVESDLGAGIFTGKWVKFSCPFCKPIRRDEKKCLLVTNGDADRGPWWVCKFCNKRGDAVAWLQSRRRMSFMDAMDYLRGPSVRYRNERKPKPLLET